MLDYVCNIWFLMGIISKTTNIVFIYLLPKALLTLKVRQSCDLTILYEILISFKVRTKAELLQLNHTQFPSMGIFVSKKVANQKNKDNFYHIRFKS